MNDIDELFKEYETDNLSVGDLGITYQGVLITNVIKDQETGEIRLFAGDPYDEDNYFEELLPERSEYQAIIEQIEEEL